MKVSGRINPIRRQIAAIQDRALSPEARARLLADRAEAAIKEAEAQNRAVLGRPVSYKTTVDGKEGAAVSAVKPDGHVVANFDLLREVLEWIGAQLVLESPRLTGRYAKSHVLEIDGRVWDAIGPMPDGEVFKFYNLQPYARKIEPRKHGKRDGVQRDQRRTGRAARRDVGQSSQAPDGVYAAVAAMARERYGELAKISYTDKNYQSGSGLSHPAIIVRML